MKDMLFKLSPFIIKSVAGEREFTFTDTGTTDEEYTTWKISNGEIYLLAEDKATKLVFKQDRLFGFDADSSGVELFPQAHQRMEFRDTLTYGVRSDVITTQQEIILTPEDGEVIAVISDIQDENFSTHPLKRERLVNLFGELFANGYKYVVFGDGASVDLALALVSNPKLSVAFAKTGDKQWLNFAISHKIWPRIGKRLESKELNFYAGLEKAIKELRLITHNLEDN